MKRLFFILLSLFVLVAEAEEITYRIVEYNKSTGDFTLSAAGQQPKGSAAWLENDFGATSGNRYNQVPRNKSASLWLRGWEGCTLRSITLNMCSNNKAGSFGLNVMCNGATLAEYPVRDFADAEWFGRWVSKDLNVYVNLQKPITSDAVVDGDVEIKIKGGTKEGSVYVNAITIEYETHDVVQTESPLGYVYEKLTAKSTLQEGDVCMLYRSGCTAADFGGVEEAYYLDAMSVASTSNVYEYGVENFTLNRDETGKFWTLTDQFDRRLGATATQKMAWDEGVTTWSIQLGYDGATIACSITKYGTIRYNAPAESYARFALYTSKTLALPYLYRRIRQNDPVRSTAIQLSSTERTVHLSEQDTVVVRAHILPSSTTDQRLVWRSSDESVAKIRDGIVELQGMGDVRITAHAIDGGAEETMLLHVTDSETGLTSFTPEKDKNERFYRINGMSGNGRGLLITEGKKVLHKR